MRTAWIVVACGSALFASVATAAGSGPLEATVKLGRARAANVRVVVDAEGVSLSAEGARQALPLRDAASIEVESVATARGLAIGIVRVSSAAGAKAGAVLVRARNGKLRFAFTGPLEPRGDPGERTWSTIDVTPASSGASAEHEVIVALRHERVAVCGEPLAAINPRVVVAETGELRPYAPARLAPNRPSIEVTASPELPGTNAPPKLHSLQVRGVSSLAGHEAPWLGSPVNALSDGDASTAWSTRPELGGRGELATATIDTAGLKVRAVALIPSAASSASSGNAAAPRSLWLVSDSGPVLHVALPQPSQAGRRYWIALPEPTAWRCLSIVLDDTGVPLGELRSAALAELEVYTDLDFEGGLEQIVKDIASAGPEASRAVDLLRRVGPSVIAPLVSAAQTMPPSGRARVVRVWSGYTAHAAAIAALRAALDDPDAKVAALAIEGLAHGGPDAHAALATRIATKGSVGDAAALVLARTAPVQALSAIVAALSAGQTERPRLREALAGACDRSGATCVERVRAWRMTASAENAAVPSVQARAAAALALSGLTGRAGVSQLVVELIASCIQDAQAFEDRWRLVLAAKGAAANDAIDAWLAKLAVEDERWMLRSASVQTLAERHSPQATPAARKALEDAYPRVRLAAAQMLARDTVATKELAVHAQRDRWPMVRAAAYEALAHHAGAEETLKAGVADRARGVRSAALHALATAKVKSAWPLVEDRLRHDNEWPEVSVAGLEYVRALCVQDAKDAVVALLLRALAPNAADFELELAAPAFETLIALGGEAAAQARKIAARPTSPAGLKAMANRSKNPASCERAGAQPPVQTP